MPSLIKWTHAQRAGVQGQLMEMDFHEVEFLAQQVNLPMFAIKNHAQLVKALIERWQRLLVSSEEALSKIESVKEVRDA